MKQIVLHHLRKVGHNQYYYTKNERVSLLGVMLILKNGFIAARGLMEKTGVSRVTTFKDLDELKQSLADFKLTIEFNKKNGYVVKGNENNKRKAIAYYLTQLFSQQGRKQLSAQVQSLLGPKLFEFALPTPVNKKKQDDFPLGISDFYEILADCEKSIGIELSDEMLQALSLNLFIICERLEKESTVQIDEYEMTALQSTPEYVTASKLAKVLEEKKGFILPENEISFLTMHLLGSRLNSVNEESQTKEMAALRKVLKDMIFDFQKFTKY
jgi:transcriptional antiterminator